jgi:two-component system, cell cycle sensor histidine kinase and response regulator CckA
VLLPASADSVIEYPAADNPGLRGTGTVLVIDDEDVVRRVAKTSLELYGYTVILAEDGAQGISIY